MILGLSFDTATYTMNEPTNNTEINNKINNLTFKLLYKPLLVYDVTDENCINTNIQL